MPRVINKFFGPNKSADEPSDHRPAGTESALDQPDREGTASTSDAMRASRPTLMAATISSPDDPGHVELVHPVYLDVPMMASFYAAEGLSIPESKDEQDTNAADKKVAISGKAEAGLSNLISHLVSLKGSVAAEREHETRVEESVAVRSLFRHTEASLFNVLREALMSANQIQHLVEEGSDEESPSALKIGQLLELKGQIVGNPLEQLLEMYDRLLPYAGVRGTPPKKSKTEVPRNPWWPLASRKASTLISRLLEGDENQAKLVEILREDLRRSHVRDLLMKGQNPDFTAVLVVSTEFFTGESADYLADGQFTVLGKVSHAGAADMSVDLKRRTALAAMSQTASQKLVSSLQKDVRGLGASGTPMPDTVVDVSLQLLPLAIYV
jgi:hypothetical protein